MDRQPYVSGNKPFLPRTSAPSVLGLSIFLRHPREERHMKAREKRERESVISAPNLKHPQALLSPLAVGEEWRHAHLHTSGNLGLLLLPRGHIVLKTWDSVKNPSWVCLERSLYKKPLVHKSANEFSCPSSLPDKNAMSPSIFGCDYSIPQETLHGFRDRLRIICPLPPYLPCCKCCYQDSNNSLFINWKDFDANRGDGLF